MNSTPGIPETLEQILEKLLSNITPYKEYKPEGVRFHVDQTAAAIKAWARDVAEYAIGDNVVPHRLMKNGLLSAQGTLDVQANQLRAEQLARLNKRLGDES